MHTICRLAGIIVATAILSAAIGTYAQETKQLPVPNVTVTAPAAPVEPPYLRNPWKSHQRNPYAGRYRVEEDKFTGRHVPRRESHPPPVASVCRATGWCRERFCLPKEEASNATWRSTWSCTTSAICRLKRAH